MREFTFFPVSDMPDFREKLLSYASQFERCAVLGSNEWEESSNEMLVGAGALDEIVPQENYLEALQKFSEAKNDWLFGFLSYDLKNEIENLSSGNPDRIAFPVLHFFQPAYVLILREDTVGIGWHPRAGESAEAIFLKIQNSRPQKVGQNNTLRIHSRVEKEEYIETAGRIREHIRRGDIYEMNYCIEFFADQADLLPPSVFLNLNERTRAPFSAFYRMANQYLMCASPERFLKKTGSRIISQPIKGTAKRGATPEEDRLAREALLNSVKEKSENVMIVDLVRNDLARICTGVKAEELFRIHSFRQWHQMISTISGTVKEGMRFTDILRNTFPMGSMTGAPKLSAMNLIERYEKTRRGLYSGAVGYITPEGDFDFNVVIRSILYNASAGCLSFQAGSAITASSVPEEEYEECLLKATSMFEVLNAVPSPPVRKEILKSGKQNSSNNYAQPVS